MRLLETYNRNNRVLFVSFIYFFLFYQWQVLFSEVFLCTKMSRLKKFFYMSGPKCGKACGSFSLDLKKHLCLRRSLLVPREALARRWTVFQKPFSAVNLSATGNHEANWWVTFKWRPAHDVLSNRWRVATSTI